LGPSFRISSALAGHQSQSAVAAGSQGNVIVAWTDAASRPLLEPGPDGSGSGVFARRYDAAGSPLGGEFRVNSFTPGDQHSPAVAVAASGQFLVVWVSDLWVSGTLQTIWGRRYDAAGTPLGDDFLLGTAGDVETTLSLAMRPDGVALVAWRSSHDSGPPEVTGRFLDADGALGGTLSVGNVSDGFLRFAPQVAFEASGAAVVAWSEIPDDECRCTTTEYVQRFADDGTALEDPIAIAAGLDALVTGPPAVASGGGKTLVVWEDDRFVFWGRFLGPPGSLAGGRFRLFDVVYGGLRPTLTGDDSGYTLVEEDIDYDDPRAHGVLAGRRLGLDGKPHGPTFEVARDIGWQHVVHAEAPALATLPNRGFVVVWNNTQDVSGSSALRGPVWGRRYALPPPGADPCRLESGGGLVCDVLHDGSGLLRLSVSVPPGATPLFGNLDGDGSDDLCWYSAGTFACDTRHNGGAAELTLAFGGPLPATPLIGDLNGDGRDDACLFRHGRFRCDTAHNGGTAEVLVQFGGESDIPLIGDVDCDGDDDPCIWNAGVFLCDTAHDGDAAEARLVLGRTGDAPLVGDIDDDGRDDFCVARSDRVICALGDGGAPIEIPFATAGAIPLLGNVDGI